MHMHLTSTLSIKGDDVCNEEMRQKRTELLDRDFAAPMNMR